MTCLAFLSGNSRNQSGILRKALDILQPDAAPQGMHGIHQPEQPLPKPVSHRSCQHLTDHLNFMKIRRIQPRNHTLDPNESRQNARKFLHPNRCLWVRSRLMRRAHRRQRATHPVQLTYDPMKVLGRLLTHLCTRIDRTLLGFLHRLVQLHVQQWRWQAIQQARPGRTLADPRSFARARLDVGASRGVRARWRASQWPWRGSVLARVRSPLIGIRRTVTHQAPS